MELWLRLGLGGRALDLLESRLDRRELRLLDEIRLVEEDAVGEGHLVRGRVGVRVMVRSRTRPQVHHAAACNPMRLQPARSSLRARVMDRLVLDALTLTAAVTLTLP